MACLVTGLYGCNAGWQPVTVPQPKPLEERQVLEFHIQVGKKDSLVRLHAVQFTRDSVSGIYWIEHTSCDTCRTSYALKDVTRAQIGKPGRGAWLIAGPVIALVAAGTLLVWHLLSSGDFGG